MMNNKHMNGGGRSRGPELRRSCTGYALMLAVFFVTVTWYIGTVAMLSTCNKADPLVPAPGVVMTNAQPPPPLHPLSVGEDEDARAPPAPLEFLVDVPPQVAGDATVRSAAASLLRVLEESSAEDGDDAEFTVAARFLASAVMNASARAAAAAAAKQQRPQQQAQSPPRRARPSNPEFTQQTCYLQSDEAEICVFDNLLCFDGKSPVVVVEDPMRDPERILDYSHSCQDFRYYEPSALALSGCAYAYSFDRAYNASLPIAPGTDFPLPLEKRRWGPQNRNGLLFFKEVSPAEIWGPSVGSDRIPPSDYKKNPLPGREDKVDLPPRFEGNAGVDERVAAPYWYSPSAQWHSGLEREGPFEHEAIPGLRLARRTRVGNRTIDWLDGSLWIAGIDGQFWQNPYHWWSKVGALYDAQRANATRGTHPDDGSFVSERAGAAAGGDGGGGHSSGSIAARLLRADDAAAAAAAAGGGAAGSPAAAAVARRPSGNTARWRSGRQWDLPPMDVVAFAGDGAIVLRDRDQLWSWFRSTVELAMQPHSSYFFADLITRLDDWHYVCATRGAIPGSKNKMFTGRSDAWMWRQYAYDAAGLGPKGILPHPRYPPRKVTVLARKGLNGRGIYNIDEVLASVNASGLSYQLVPNMASLSFNAQVELMAGTGILIAPHGAHLANAMFMPAHSVVIELFPYLMKKNTYRHLSTLLDLHYMPVYSWELLPLNETYARQFYGVDLMREKYYYDKCVRINISSYEALTEHACNAMSKNYPIIVSPSQFDQVLRDAADSIGAFSMLNPEWAAMVDREGIPVPPREAMSGPATIHHKHAMAEVETPPSPPVIVVAPAPAAAAVAASSE